MAEYLHAIVVVVIIFQVVVPILHHLNVLLVITVRVSVHTHVMTAVSGAFATPEIHGVGVVVIDEDRRWRCRGFCCFNPG
jgi:hypothetical protein